MVWKDNFLVNGIPKTLEGFIDEVFGLEKAVHSDFFLFTFPLFHFKNPKDIFDLGLHLDEKHFPKHFFFANFQCLRCGLCCKNYECVAVDWNQVNKWIVEDREDILQYVVGLNLPFFPEIYPRAMIGCPMSRKVKNKAYYICKINDVKEYIPVCKSYLCSKSIPIAHLNYKDIDELIQKIGIDEYYSLIERNWDEEFDFSTCWKKTHKKIIKK